ncbi:MAG: hypothetical protein MRY83_04695 [Flavobacteriales bacterium]|nr:hypothetical protein [Flavobacteriales bacterium]
MKFPLKFQIQSLFSLLIILSSVSTIFASDKTGTKKTVAKVKIKEHRGSYRISNDTDHEVKVLVIHNNTATQDLCLQPGERTYFWSCDMENGKYVLFVQGNYNEVEKLISWNVIQ